MEVGKFLGGLHPLLVHFPIVLLLMAVATDLLAFLRRDNRCSWAGFWLTLIGTASAMITFVCGILAEVFAARAGVPQEPMEAHERLATIATWLFLALANWRLFMGALPRRRTYAPYLVLALIGCGLLVLAAHRGGEAVYQYGANVAHHSNIPSEEDLATVAQHQQEETLQYSNQMHWIFGWIVLALGIIILCERLQLGPLARLRVLMPFLFLGGGVYLAIFSDWDSWPLSRLRPITDTEVLLHKTIAVLLFVVGMLALRRRAGSVGAQRWAWQNRLIAAMSLVGGGLLFTHIHTNAPYTNVAVGVYLNHAAMGTVALAIAAAMLLADRCPNSRGVGLLYPVLLILQAGLLLQYNEDLPWFMGYTRISNQPPHGGLLAHLADGRAEMVFNGESGRVDLYLLAARTEEPRMVAGRLLPAVVDTNAERFPLSLRPMSDAKRTDHFFAVVPRLRQVAMFRLLVSVPLEGPSHEAASTEDGGAITWERTEFEPCVTAPLLPPLVGTEFVYSCPMCVDVKSVRPGRCSMCGMVLQREPYNGSPHAIQPMHEDAYRMDMEVSPPNPRVGDNVTLKFLMKRAADSVVVKDLRLVHEKLMHLVMASRNLARFEHLHPRLQPDGSLIMPYSFARGGRYVLFAEASPQGHRPQTFRFELTVGGGSESDDRPVDLHDDHDIACVVDDYAVSLRLTPQRVQARREAHMVFTIERDGRPVEDLGLFLGALGHCVVISEDTSQIVHAHAVQLTAAAPPPGGPSVVFDAVFPRAGNYRVWGQFAHEGKIVTADFTVRVD